MHGIYLLVFAPLAAVVAWRYSGPMMRKLALFASVTMSVGLVGWFGYHAVVGAEFTGSVYDRVMNSLGVIVGAVNFPVVQLLLGAMIIVCWPRKFEFGSSTAKANADAKTDANLDPVPKLEPVPVSIPGAELQ